MNEIRMSFKQKVNLREYPSFAKSFALKKRLDVIHSNIDRFNPDKYACEVLKKVGVVKPTVFTKAKKVVKTVKRATYVNKN